MLSYWFFANSSFSHSLCFLTIGLNLYVYRISYLKLRKHALSPSHSHDFFPRICFFALIHISLAQLKCLTKYLIWFVSYNLFAKTLPLLTSFCQTYFSANQLLVIFFSCESSHDNYHHSLFFVIMSMLFSYFAYRLCHAQSYRNSNLGLLLCGKEFWFTFAILPGHLLLVFIQEKCKY